MFKFAKRHAHGLLLLALTTWLVTKASAEPAYKSLAAGGGEIAAPHGNLDITARKTAILKAAEPLHGRITLLVEGETTAKEWAFTPGAEVWMNGWWGRLDQFAVGDRVWVWFEKDRAKQPVRIAFLADEVTEQSLYAPLEINSIDADSSKVTLEFTREKKSAVRSIKLAGAELYRAGEKAPLSSLKVGEKLFVQTVGEQVRLMLDAEEFEKRKAAQKATLRQRWTDEGLPGTLIFSHSERNELEIMLDHEGMSWGRFVKEGDQVTLRATENSIPAVVKRLRPWHERTQLLLGFNGSSELPPKMTVGQRVTLRLKAAPVADDEQLPTGLGKSVMKSERIEWIMSSMYCTCGMHDGCAGHVFTLAACDAGPGHTCGLARGTRQKIAELIDAGETDRQVFETLLKERGPNLVRPHMLP